EAVGRRTGEREVVYAAHHSLAGEVSKHVTVKLIAAALGDDVEDAARRLAILGAERASLDFDFLHELERKVRTAAAKCRVRCAHAVQNVVVLGSRGAGDRRIAVTAGGIAQARTRHSGRNVVQALYRTRRWEIQKLVGADVRAVRGCLNVDRASVASA